jgi:hypothetical protein
MSEDKTQDPIKGERNVTPGDQDEGKILDPQTLENLAAFLNRDTEETKNEQTFEPKAQIQDFVEYNSPSQ